MMMKSTLDSPILVTGAAGAIGAIGRNLTAMLIAKGHKVRALVRREDERADTSTPEDAVNQLLRESVRDYSTKSLPTANVTSPSASTVINSIP